MKIMFTASTGVVIRNVAPGVSFEDAVRDLPPEANPVEIDESRVPADRAFRDAWLRKKDGIAVDMPRARNIHRERLRSLRKPLLEALDVEYQRADERADAMAKAAISAKKQVLRDVTVDPAIEAAKSTSDLAVPKVLL